MPSYQEYTGTAGGTSNLPSGTYSEYSMPTLAKTVAVVSSGSFFGNISRTRVYAVNLESYTEAAGSTSGTSDLPSAVWSEASLPTLAKTVAYASTGSFFGHKFAPRKYAVVQIIGTSYDSGVFMDGQTSVSASATAAFNNAGATLDGQTSVSVTGRSDFVGIANLNGHTDVVASPVGLTNATFEADGQGGLSAQGTGIANATFEADGHTDVSVVGTKAQQGTSQADGHTDLAVTANSDFISSFHSDGVTDVSVTGNYATSSGAEADGSTQPSFSGGKHNIGQFHADGIANVGAIAIKLPGTGVAPKMHVDGSTSVSFEATKFTFVSASVEFDGKTSISIVAQIENPGKPFEIINILPPLLIADGRDIVLQIEGHNFYPECVALWTASPSVELETTFIDRQHMTAVLPGTVLQNAIPGARGAVSSRNNATDEETAPYNMAVLSRSPEKGAVRLTDKSTGHGPWAPRPNDTASPTVFVNGKPWHRKGDHWAVHCAPPNCHDGVLNKGAKTVLVNNKQAGRKLDLISDTDRAAQCSGNVLVGESGQRLRWVDAPLPWEEEAVETWFEI